jgi:uncharacterized protein YegL
MARTNEELEEMPRKTAFLFFLIDTSGSMAGPRIGAVNSAIEEVLVKIKEMNDTSTDAIVEIALLTFDSNVQWLTPNGPVKPENYYFNHLDASGLTAMGEAFRSLETKLHKGSGFMKRASGSYAPVIFLMSDGEPNDGWESNLALLKQNKWFNLSAKVALAVGDDITPHVLEQFTGTKEAIVHISDKDVATKLAKMISFIAVKSSQIVSTPLDSSGATAQDKINTILADAKKDDDWDLSGDGW